MAELEPMRRYDPYRPRLLTVTKEEREARKPPRAKPQGPRKSRFKLTGRVKT